MCSKLSENAQFHCKNTTPNLKHLFSGKNDQILEWNHNLARLSVRSNSHPSHSGNEIVQELILFGRRQSSEKRNAGAIKGCRRFRFNSCYLLMQFGSYLSNR